jgi:thiamine biosynthesis lipoprotein
MNSNIEILVNSGNSSLFVKEFVDNAYDKFDLVVKKYSRFSETSELTRLNKSSGKKFKCSEEFYKLIKYSIEIAYLTDGEFDPTIIDILESYGYTKGSKIKDKIDSNKNLQELISSRPSYKEIQFFDKSREIKLAENQGIDLGAIGKGYAIDLAFQVLKEKFDNFLINAGGDIRVSGHNEEGKPWQIELEYILDKKKRKLGRIEIAEGSICSSGAYARKVGEFHHLINPKSGIPNNSLASSFVYSDNALHADTLSTIAFLLGTKFPNYYKELNKQFMFDYLLIDQSGSILKSKDFKLVS